MGRRILCEKCGSTFDEQILIDRHSENTCLVCGASLGMEDSPKAPEEELIDWYYYDLGGGTYYLDDKYAEDDESSRLAYSFKAPKDLNKAKEILRQQYDSSAFAPPDHDDISHKSPGQLIKEGRCPKCGSRNIQLVQKKWSVWTGFRTNAVQRVCAQCLYRF